MQIEIGTRWRNGSRAGLVGALLLGALLAGGLRPGSARAQGEQLTVTPGAGTFADENLAVPLPATLGVSYGGQHWEMRALGSGLRKKLVFKVYVAALYVDDKAALGADPAADVCGQDIARHITLTMKRGLAADKISEAIHEGFVNSVWRKEPDEALRKKLDEFVAGFTGELKEGDRVELTYLPGVGLLTALGGRSLPIVAEPRIARDIWCIWLGAKPVSGDLRKGLVRLVTKSGEEH